MKIGRFIQGALAILQFFLIVVGGIQIGNLLGLPGSFPIGLSVVFALYCVVSPYYPEISKMLESQPKRSKTP